MTRLLCCFHPFRLSPPPEEKIRKFVSAGSSVATVSSLPKSAVQPGQLKNKERHMAQKLVMQYRRSVSERVQREMANTGTDWRAAARSHGLHTNSQKNNIKFFSKQNVSSLRRNLGFLKDYEVNFIAKIIDEPLFISHATSSRAIDRPDGSVTLFSRKKLIERGISFPLENTEDHDISAVRSDDNVFFSLEAGKIPGKTASRFGERLLRFNFDQDKVSQTASLHLFDPYSMKKPDTSLWLHALSDHPDARVAEKLNQILKRRTYSLDTAVFFAEDMKIGLALSIVEACRYLPKALREDILLTAPINSIVNGFFRPTVMVPRHFFDTPVDISKIAKFNADTE